MSASQINYRESYFQHPSLTKISGDPTYNSLAKLEKECKANGKSVRSTLGGGNQGHLGLVSTALAYERSSPGVPFVRPTLPVLPALADSTAAQIADARHTYNDNMDIFKTCHLIERTIVQQINTALDEDVLADLIDDETGLLTGTVPEILQNLFDTYGVITPQSLAAAKAKLETTTYNHSRPIVNIFTAINDYANMAEAAKAAETTSQLINIGMIIITRSTIFASDIRKWHAKEATEKTWPLFKDHFKAAQKAIKQSQPTITTDSLGFHEQANAASLVDQVIKKLTTQRDNETADYLAEQQIQQQIDSMANSTQQNSNMLEQMQSLAATMSKLQNQVNNNNHTSNHHQSNRGQHQRGRGNDNNRDNRNHRNGRSTNKPAPKYCWTHGNCAHNGADCHTPADGHVKDATYANMQGGSQAKCHWL
jgi:hypothetical protein